MTDTAIIFRRERTVELLEQEKGNFRGRLFGGFNRRDVIDYIEVLAGERGELERENQKLRERIWELENPEAGTDGAESVLPEETGEAEAVTGDAAGEGEETAKPVRHARVRVYRTSGVDKRRRRCRRYSI